MQVSVETTGELERRLTISVPAIEVDAVVEKKLKETAKKVRINGFRPGKVPVMEVQRRYGQSVRAEAVSEIIHAHYDAAVAEQALTPAGLPKVEIQQDEANAPLEFIATVEVFPTIAAVQTAAISIERPVAEVTDVDVAQAIEKLREQKVRWVAKDAAAELKDKVVFDFEGRMNGELFEGGSQKNHSLILGSNSMIPGFEEQIAGMKVGEERTIQVTFPADYSAEHLKGQAAEFLIHLQTVEAPQLPELDEAFFRSYGVSGDDLSVFKAEVRKNLEHELKEGKRLYLKLQVIEGLLQENPLTVPRALVETESRRLRDQKLRQMLGQNELPDWAQNFPTDVFVEEAERMVKASLLLDGVRTLHSIEPDANRVKERIEHLAARYQSPEDVVKWYYSDAQEMRNIEQRVLEDQIVDHVLSVAQVADKALSYDEVLKGPQSKALQSADTNPDN